MRNSEVLSQAEKLGVVVAALLAGLAMWACGPQASAGGGGGGGWPDNRTFLSTSVIEDTKDRPMVAGTRISLQFFPDGRMSAQAGCNHLGGTGTIEEDKLVLGEMSMTEMACDPARMEQDTWLGNFLGSRPAWSLVGDELVLQAGGVEIRLADREVVDPDRPLVGPRWVVDTIITGEAASSVPAGAEAFLLFDAAGGMTGSTGCAALTGTVEVRATSIVFPAPLPSPVPQCTDGKALDEAVRATLLGEVGYSIEADGLTLTGPDGHGLVLRATT